MCCAWLFLWLCMVVFYGCAWLCACIKIQPDRSFTAERNLTPSSFLSLLHHLLQLGWAPFRANYTMDEVVISCLCSILIWWYLCLLLRSFVIHNLSDRNVWNWILAAQESVWGDVACLSEEARCDGKTGCACLTYKGVSPPHVAGTCGELWGTVMYSEVLWGTLRYSEVLWGTMRYIL